MNDTITMPQVMPADGMRELTGREAAQRARAMACIHQLHPEQCQGQVYVSLFFDGTGNNKDWDEPGLDGTQQSRNKHSNIARLYNARLDEPENGFFAYYVPGLGTPFKEIGDYGSNVGSGFGYMGADRINWGITRVLNAVHLYLTDIKLIEDDQARVIVNNASKSFANLGFEGPYRRMVLDTWEERLAGVVQSRQRKVTQINIALFGFSRGAAMARVFANWFFDMFEHEDGGHKLAGVPVRIYFMGLFDTVASVGVPGAIPGAKGHMAWADENLGISPAVEQCVHFIALHEQRASFPLELAAGAKQVAYPGMHSDVGGGYRPGEQGKAMPAWGASAQLSQVPLIDMYHAAIKGGLPMLTPEEIKGDPDLARDFDCPPALVTAVNDFYRACGITESASGQTDVKAMIQAHTRQYLQWRLGLYGPGDGLGNRRFYRDAAQGSDREKLKDSVKDFSEHLRFLHERWLATKGSRVDLLGDHLPISTAVFRQFSDDPLQPLDEDSIEMLRAVASNVTVPEAVCKLMDDYIHDSRAGFLVNGEMESRRLSGGYFRYRMIFQNAWKGYKRPAARAEDNDIAQQANG